MRPYATYLCFALALHSMQQKQVYNCKVNDVDADEDMVYN